MEIRCTRRLQFAYGHRVMGHENRCRHLHGHNGVVYVTAVRSIDTRYPPGAMVALAAEPVDSLGRVVDFSVLKELLGGWIDKYWDHAFIYYAHDTAVIAALSAFTEAEHGAAGWLRRHALPCNPTAENMARYLLEVVCPQVMDGTGVRVVEVTFHETENCFATARERP